MEEKIVDAIVTRLTTDTNLAEIKYVSFDKVRVSTSDFQDTEIPAVQIWDTGQTIEHQRGRKLVTWNLTLELVMRSSEQGYVDQKGLMVLRRKIEQALWDKPNLEIPGVVHLVYAGNFTDLHMVEPEYITQLNFAVLFYDDLTGSC